jgi:urease accessory protein
MSNETMSTTIDQERGELLSGSIGRNAPMERSDGRVELAFKRSAATTIIARLHQQGCGKARLPRPTDAHHAEAVLINLSGGLTGGDRIDWQVVWQPETMGTVSGQAAEKIYRAIGMSVAAINTRLDVGSNALAIWLPQETILFNRARLVRRNRFNVAPGGRLLAAEATIMGRQAMGETVTAGLFDEGFEVFYGDRLVFADRQRFQGALVKLLGRPAIAGGACAFVSLLYVGHDATERLGTIRNALEGLPAAATSPDLNVVLIRWMTAEPAGLRTHMMAALLALQRALDLPPRLPRVWSC